MSDYVQKKLNGIYRQLKELDPAHQDLLIDKLKHDGLAQAAREIKKSKTVYFGDLYADVLDRQKTFASFEGILTGLKYFDNATMGLRPGEVTVIAGPSNLGKTMVALNIAASAAIHAGTKTLIVSMEMPAIDIASRLYNMADDHEKLMENLIIQTELDVNTRHIAAMIERHKPDLVMLDHIQFLANQEKGQNEYERINFAVKRIQRMASEFSIPIIMISHVSKSRGGHDQRASAGDLKGSSSIEQDVDIVFMLNRDVNQRIHGLLDIELVKHRKKSSKLYYRACQLEFDGVRLANNGAYTLNDSLLPPEEDEDDEATDLHADIQKLFDVEMPL